MSVFIKFYPTPMLHLKNFTPDLQKFTQINLSYLWYFTTLHHAKMSSEYDPDDAHYDDPGYDAYWHGYNHGHRDGYDKGTCCIINIIILSTMTIIITITRLFKRRVPTSCYCRLHKILECMWLWNSRHMLLGGCMDLVQLIHSKCFHHRIVVIIWDHS